MAEERESGVGRFIKGAIKGALIMAACVALFTFAGPIATVVGLKGVGALFSASSWSIGAAASAGDIICIGPLLSSAASMISGMGAWFAGGAALFGADKAFSGAMQDRREDREHQKAQAREQAIEKTGRSRGRGRSGGDDLTPANTPDLPEPSRSRGK